MLPSELSAQEPNGEPISGIEIKEYGFPLIPEQIQLSYSRSRVARIPPLSLYLFARMPLNFFQTASYFSELGVSLHYEWNLSEKLNFGIGSGIAPMLYRSALLLAGTLHQDFRFILNEWLILGETATVKIYGEGLTMHGEFGPEFHIGKSLLVSLAGGVNSGYSWNLDVFAYGFYVALSTGVRW
jgi:hypothetical protein